ncbi:MAG: NAD(P)-dependent oxidoreductase [Bacteroidales bacterium]|jgi:D-3-phosphoglycerate dehydrogenase
MTKVLLATVKPFAQAAVEGIRKIFDEAGFQLSILEKYASQDELVSVVSDADAIILRSDIIDKQVIDAGKNLKIVVRAGAGYDNVDLKAATAKGVCVMNTPGQNSNAVAELGIGMMIYMNRNRFNGTPGTELRWKTFGLHAYGNIGKIMGHIGKGLGMEISAHDPYIDRIIVENDGVKYVSDVKELYKKCEYIAVNLPANEKTKGIINYDLMSSMPNGATIVNTARKEIVDEPSLLKMFENRDDFRYITDIAPDCQDILKEKYAERYLATPKKMGAQTAEANINAGLAAARQIVGYIKEGDTTFKVN